MTYETTYCSACHKQVRFTLRPVPRHGGHANLPDGNEFVCLDFGEGCTNDVCPLAGLPPIVMGVRLARSGETAGEWKTVHGICDACEQAADLKVLDGDYAFCPLCESTVRLVMVRLDDQDYVAVTGKARTSG